MEFCVFSKHLQAYGYRELGKALKSIGVGGADLTVRAKGHVLPEQVKDKLPEAFEALRAEGVRVSMVTTNITSAEEPYARETLETAAKLGVKYFKIGYLVYDDFGGLARALREGNARIRGIGELAKSLGMFGGYHNHSGEYLGSTVAHMHRLIEGTDPSHIGVFYDVAHATVEGALYGWKQGFEDLAARIGMIALKDFEIEKREGLHLARVVPMGEGLVQWKAYVRCLATIEKQVGVASIHAEYDWPAEKVLAQAKKDKEFFEEVGKEA